ncbi:hypothetical protein MIMGU_mgv1a015551mg [Erythranthe guttata]|uniref:BAG domain-containing protein n=1 Tax=Erythranthe guttata TaxID=4155 RepID=A0A022QJJ5_ERYGU|nr:PREDICTED: BAG family molecular chaperone regulator 4 isoform X1 [Erythranthe guttata]EYU26685.1 hypothetical protein MIMGU_mgv1a015551mg [Erythranthe guttata]|eukprot:XP_012850349.1 PREDICTED: BAG family molecular chaperone regulator 4 isoform X1 [Erythranthe guttata]
MKNLNRKPEMGRRNGVIGLGLMPDHWPTTSNIINVSFPLPPQYPSTSTTPAPEDEPKSQEEEISKGEEAVAQVRKEVDILEHQVFALQVVVNNGSKVDGKEISYLTEMLMMKLLKLDGIEAEGEGRAQRRMQVRRVQGIVEKLDLLKLRNSKL